MVSDLYFEDSSLLKRMWSSTGSSKRWKERGEGEWLERAKCLGKKELTTDALLLSNTSLLAMWKKLISMVVYIRNSGAPKVRLQPLKIRFLRQGNWSAGPRQGTSSLVANWMFSLLARNSFSVAVSNNKRFPVELELDLDLLSDWRGGLLIHVTQPPFFVGHNFGNEGSKPWTLQHDTYYIFIATSTVCRCERLQTSKASQRMEYWKLSCDWPKFVDRSLRLLVYAWIDFVFRRGDSQPLITLCVIDDDLRDL